MIGSTRVFRQGARFGRQIINQSTASRTAVGSSEEQQGKVIRLHLEACPRASGQMLHAIHSPRCGQSRQHHRALASSAKGCRALEEPSSHPPPLQSQANKQTKYPK